MFEEFSWLTICGRDVSLFDYSLSDKLIVYSYRGVHLERCGNLYRMDGAIGIFYELADVLNDIDKKLGGK